MITKEQIDQRRQDTLDLSTLAMSDTNNLMAQLLAEDPDIIRQTLSEFLPSLVDPYISAAGDLAITDYMGDRAASGLVGRGFKLAPVMADIGKYEALINWATVVLLMPGGAADQVVKRLSAGVSKMVFNGQRDTTLKAVESDPSPARWQRVASAGCCDFCAMLASRGAAYTSKKAASSVVGRGAELGSHRLALGVRPRGEQNLGTSFHDHCRCVAVGLTNGNRAELTQMSDDWFEVYGEAVTNVERAKPRTMASRDVGGRIKSMWVDEAGALVTNDQHVKDILKAMRDIRAANA